VEFNNFHRTSGYVILFVKLGYFTDSAKHEKELEGGMYTLIAFSQEGEGMD